MVAGDSGVSHYEVRAEPWALLTALVVGAMTALTLSGGAAMADVLKRLEDKLDTGKSVAIGFLAGATYPDGTPVAMIAAIQDFGAPAANIPPRPFFRNMIADKSAGWPAAIDANLKATGYDSALTLAQVGEGIAGQLRQSINDFVGVPLSPKTIARKGFSKALIDTSHMLNSVDYEVET
jgi:hypothetical protein